MPEPIDTTRITARQRWARHWIRAHLVTAAAAGLLIAGPTSLTEIAVIPPAVIFLLFSPWTFHLWRDAWRRPVLVLLLAFAAWLAIGLVYSPNRDLGVEEFGNLRFFLVVLLLIPAFHLPSPGRGAADDAPLPGPGRSLTVAAVALGFLAGNVVQALNAWALLGNGPESLDFGRLADRISGWWDSAVAGTVLTAALGLHLPAALMGRGRARLVALGGSSVTLVALVATGSRGGWAASAALLLLTFAVGGFRALRSGRGRAAFFASLATFLIVLGGTAFALRAQIGERIGRAHEQLTAAAEGHYDSVDGARLAMKKAALEAFLRHPIMGVGTGGFSAWAREHTGFTDEIHDHAHDTLLHAAASNGLVGVVLLIAIAAAALLQAWAWARPRGLGTYAAGPLFALLGLIFTTPFDTLYVSGNAAAVTGMIVALCAHPPPRQGEPDDAREG
ncbi:MAG: O-antigen ligase family protein [Phycisphaeraceae bacterium]|nr:MAG: O-antigen ligase family protein [Phycisphaeraceae bacterium]